MKPIFEPVREHNDQNEQAAMQRRFERLDGKMIHEKYGTAVDGYEEEARDA